MTTLTKPSKTYPWLNAIGVEMEGGWYRAMYKDQIYPSLPRGFRYGQMKTDSSVSGMSEADRTTKARVPHQALMHPSGEYITPPLSLGRLLTQFDVMYPDLVNRTCGMHVHVSFRSTAHLRKLADEEFYKLFRARWKEWAESGREKGLLSEYDYTSLMNRLGDGTGPRNSRNGYCKDDFSEFAAGLRGNQTDRYVALNVNCYRKLGTVECRLLPGFRDHKAAISAVKQLVRIYHEWLTGEYKVPPWEVVADANTVSIAKGEDAKRVAGVLGTLEAKTAAETGIVASIPKLKPGFIRGWIINGQAVIPGVNTREEEE